MLRAEAGVTAITGLWPVFTGYFIALPRPVPPQDSSRGRFAGGAEQVELEDDEEEPLEDVSDSSAEQTSSSRRAGPSLFTSDRKQFWHLAPISDASGKMSPK